MRKRKEGIAGEEGRVCAIVQALDLLIAIVVVVVVVVAGGVGADAVVAEWLTDFLLSSVHVHIPVDFRPDFAELDR